MNSTSICPDVVPKYYTVTLTLMACISFPINSTGVWLVWFHSPQMGKFKYCLMYLQIATFMTENWFSFSPGYYFFPMIAGYNLSFLGEFLTGHIVMTIWGTLLCFELPSLFICFMYRHDAAIGINNSKNSLKYLNYFSSFVAHLLPPFFATTFQLSLLTYDQKYNLLKTKYPQCLHFADNRSFEVYDWNINSWIITCGIGSLALALIVVSYGFGLGIHTMHILHKLRVHMSAETFKMHKSALISLSMQCVIPSIFLIVPIYTILVIVIYQINGLHEHINFAFFGICSHSCISTIVMITTNSRYLSTLKNKLKPVLIFQKAPIHRRSISVSIPRSMSIVRN